ncbi:addiction module protein [bacterium]|nr:addiction module protein [bacterium]
MKPITLSDILELSVPERIQLAEDIWDSVAENPEALDLTEEQKRILDQRFESYQRNPQAVLSWDEIKNQIRNR